MTNFLSKLNVVLLKRPQKQSPQEKRRSNLVSKLQEQAELCKAQIEGKKFVVMKNATTRDEAGNRTKIQREKNVRAWFWPEGSAMAMCIKYGARAVEIQKGKKALSVPNLQAIPETINTIIAAVNAGELDAQIDSVIAASKIKQRA